MTQPIKYTMTNESISFVHEGESKTVKAGAPNYANLRNALLHEKWDDAVKHMTVEKSVDAWGKDLGKLTKGKFAIRDGKAFFKGKELPDGMSKRIQEMSSKGEDPLSIFKFWERLQLNPSYRSVRQLWDFLQHENIPILKNGFFLAYKGVTDNYKDVHSNTYDNSPGVINEMPRNEISDDPKVACHEGFHVGALSYARGFGPRTVVCRIDPQHVVCVPYDYSSQKVRVCKYEVVGNYGSPLPNTIYEDEEFDEETGSLTRLADSLGFTSADKDGGLARAEKAERKVTKKETKTKGGGTAVTTKKEAPKGWEKFHKMGMRELMDLSLDDLRQYAHKGVQLVGASKIPGGKTALVAAILKIRK